MPLIFSWKTFNVASLLPSDWQQDIAAVAAHAEFRKFPRTPILSREADHVTHILRGRVRADTVQQGLPWLYRLYRTEFVGLAAQACQRPLSRPSMTGTGSC